MTALAQRIKETPMAPYLGLLQSMSNEEKQIVVTFLTESMEEPDESTKASYIENKFKDLKISAEVRSLRGCIKLTDEDIKDERTKYILER